MWDGLLPGDDLMTWQHTGGILIGTENGKALEEEEEEEDEYNHRVETTRTRVPRHRIIMPKSRRSGYQPHRRNEEGR